MFSSRSSFENPSPFDRLVRTTSPSSTSTRTPRSRSRWAMIAEIVDLPGPGHAREPEGKAFLHRVLPRLDGHAGPPGAPARSTIRMTRPACLVGVAVEPTRQSDHWAMPRGVASADLWRLPATAKAPISRLRAQGRPVLSGDHPRRCSENRASPVILSKRSGAKDLAVSLRDPSRCAFRQAGRMTNPVESIS